MKLRIIGTVIGITAFGLASLWGFVITKEAALLGLAGAAGGALFSYLGRVNGNAANSSGS